MAVENEVRPDHIGRQLGTILVQPAGVVEALWMTTAGEAITFWVLTQPIDTATQQSLYERTAALYEQFPDVLFEVHILNPEWFEGGDARSALPPDAQPIALSAA